MTDSSDQPPRRKRRLKAWEMQALDGAGVLARAMGGFKLSRDPGLEIECIALENAIQSRLDKNDKHIIVAEWLRAVAEGLEDGKIPEYGDTAASRFLHDTVMDLLDAGHTREAVAEWLRSAADEVDEQAPELPQ